MESDSDIKETNDSSDFDIIVIDTIDKKANTQMEQKHVRKAFKVNTANPYIENMEYKKRVNLGKKDNIAHDKENSEDKINSMDDSFKSDKNTTSFLDTSCDTIEPNKNSNCDIGNLDVKPEKKLVFDNATQIGNKKIDNKIDESKNASTDTTNNKIESVDLNKDTIEVTIVSDDISFPIIYSTSSTFKDLYSIVFGQNEGKLFYKNMLLSKYSTLRGIKFAGDSIKAEGKCIYKGIQIKIYYDFEKYLNLVYFRIIDIKTVIDEIEKRQQTKVKCIRNNAGNVEMSYQIKDDEVFDVFF